MIDYSDAAQQREAEEAVYDRVSSELERFVAELRLDADAEELPKQYSILYNYNGK